MFNDFNTDYNVRNDGQMHQGAINLDDMPEEDLEIAAIHPALHETVHTYASKKLFATELRLQGLIDYAKSVEDKLDRVYKTQIPAQLKW